MTDSLQKLPLGWEQVPFADVARLIRGVTYKKEVASAVSLDGHLPLLRATNITGAALTFEELVYVPQRSISDEQLLREGDVVIASSSGSKEVVGKAGQFHGGSFRGSFGAFCTSIRPEMDMCARYIGYYCQSPNYRKVVSDISAGSNINNIKSSELAAHLVPVPPRNEQTRIVEKLEELLSDLDAGVAELRAAQKKLAQYRQSLLKAAVEGALTAEWRQSPAAASAESAESGAALLARILRARRARWEDSQLAKFKAQGKTPPQGWQAKYPEPVAPDVTDLLELPQGWIWTTVDHLLSRIETGKSFKCEERPPQQGEIGVVKVSAVSWGEYDEQESKTCMDEALIRPKLFVQPGDFLFSRANTMELVGACVIAKSVEKQIMLSDKILRFVLVEGFLKDWLLTVLRSEFGRGYIERFASGNQESMRNIGQEKICQIPIPLPPRSEIEFCSELLMDGIEGAKAKERALSLSLRQASAQRKNILQAAFSGQLVRQDPADEPASVLLERIRAERTARQTNTMPRRRAATTK